MDINSILDSHGIGKGSGKGYSLKGTGNFAGSVGVVITHSLGHANFVVQVTPTQYTDGYLGEVSVVKTTTDFTIYNTGSFTGTFDYLVFE